MAGFSPKRFSLQWRHNGRDGASNHQPVHCLLNRLFRRRSKKTSKLCVTGLCAGNSPVTGEFPAQMASNAENVSIWWRHHAQFLNKLRRNLSNHCSDVKWASRHFNSPGHRLYVQQFVQVDIKGNIKAPHHWPFVRGIYKSPVDSLYKGPVMRNAFPCHNIFMNTEQVLSKAQNFLHMPDSSITKSHSFSLLWKTTHLERP